jgi:hypothetical protein
MPVSKPYPFGFALAMSGRFISGAFRRLSSSDVITMHCSGFLVKKMQGKSSRKTRVNCDGGQSRNGDGAARGRTYLRRVRELQLALYRLLGDRRRRLSDRLDLPAFVES